MCIPTDPQDREAYDEDRDAYYVEATRCECHNSHFCPEEVE